MKDVIMYNQSLIIKKYKNIKYKICLNLFYIFYIFLFF